MTSLTPAQHAIVTAPLAPMLVVAGAGSGKTHTMAARVAWLSDADRGHDAIDPDAILGLTFTRKAAGELAERLAHGRVATGIDDLHVGAPQVSTYHSFAAAIVTEFGHHIGHDGDTALVGEAAAFQIVDGVVRDWRAALPVDLAPATVALRVKSLAAECAEHAIDVSDVDAALHHALTVFDDADARGGLSGAWSVTPREVLRTRLAILPLVAAYARRKADLGVVDYGDQVVMALAVAQQATVVDILRQRHRVVILDEYQDTSSAQSRLLSSIFARGHPVTAVGDPKQSIFGWRGAGAGTLRRFLTQFATPDPDSRDSADASHLSRPLCVYLSTSWRNDRVILDVANTVADGLTPDAGLGAVPHLQPRPTAEDGSVQVAWLATTADEAELIATWLARRRAPGRTQAVLCRTRASFAPIVGRLEHAGMPVSVVGLGGLLDEPVVVDVLSVVAAAHDPSDDPAALRLLTGPRWSVAPADLDALARRARRLGTDQQPAGLAEALDQASSDDGLSVAGQRRLHDLADVLARVRSVARELPVVDVLAYAARACGVEIESAVWSPDPRRPTQVMNRLIGAAIDFGAVTDAGVGAFLAWAQAARDYERGLDAVDIDPDPDAVQILTIHAAKGLEWDDVVVVDLAQGGFPSRPRGFHWLSGDGGVPWPCRGDADGLPVWSPPVTGPAAAFKRAYDDFVAASRDHAADEERRLAYVACTRARHGLLLTGAIWVRDRVTPRQPSPYLVEARAVAGVVTRIWAPPDTPAPLREATSVSWPAPPPAEVALRLDQAHARVVAAMRAGDPLREVASDSTSTPWMPTDGAEAEWSALVDRLLAEAASTPRSLTATHVSASTLVAMGRDRDGAVADLIRPIPTMPRAGARRGTRFHSWVERRLTTAALLDLDDVPGAADEDTDDDLATMQQRFDASEWAMAAVVDVEVPFDIQVATAVGSISVRGRIDAVFRRADGGVDVVDWKTGPQPSSAEIAVQSVQLAVYRLAAARLYDIDIEDVHPAFWHARTGRTTRPTHVADDAALRELVQGAYEVGFAGGGASSAATSAVDIDGADTPDPGTTPPDDASAAPRRARSADKSMTSVSSASGAE